jgi:hypothetical protein
MDAGTYSGDENVDRCRETRVNDVPRRHVKSRYKPYVCTYVLRFHDGSITMQGLDPHGPSDVLFAITGGTGAYAGATGQARYVDSDTQTDIYIDLG